MKIQRGAIVACHYFTLPDRQSALLSRTETYYHRDGTEHTLYDVPLRDVPLRDVIESVESHIKSHVPADTRTEVYHKVLHGMPGHRRYPSGTSRHSIPTRSRIPPSRYVHPLP